MDDFLRDTSAMEAMFLDAFHDNEPRDDAHIPNTFFESLESASTTTLFGPRWLKYTQLGRKMLLYNVK